MASKPRPKRIRVPPVTGGLPRRVAKENLDGIEAASKAGPGSANYWADQA